MKKSIIIVSAALAACLTSCHFLDLEPGIISKETFYKSAEEVKYGLAGVYGTLSNDATYGSIYSLAIANTDDLCYFNRPASPSYDLQQYHYDAGNNNIYQAWTRLYAGIRNANAVMEAVAGSEFDPDGVMYSEARFLRAFYHFLLAQAWGDVPLRDKDVTNHDGVMCAATPQLDVLTWAASEMEDCVQYLEEDVNIQPSRVTKDVAHGVLARLYLFLAGESVKGGDKTSFFTKARDHAYAVIEGGRAALNPDYSQVFINYITDSYDTEYHESMWEVEFLGDRSSASYWSNGRIGESIGLQSTGSTGYDQFQCNYAYGQYDGTLKLWDLYWVIDRTDEEKNLPAVTDARQAWNMPPYNYAGSSSQPPYGVTGSGSSRPSIDKTPYTYSGKTTTVDPMTAQGIRNCGKYRREVVYEGVKTAKMLFTTINYPLLRYADVLLMYAEAANECAEAPSREAYDCVKAVRDRAGIATLPFEAYDQASFRQLVRNERGRELCFESLRKWDLIRWGIFVQSMHEYGQWTADERWVKNAKATYAASIGSAVNERHVLLPIPSIELGVNTLLKQNPLW